MKPDTSQPPIYQHYVYDKGGRFIFLRYSKTPVPFKEYIELEKYKTSVQQDFSKGIWEMPPDKRKEALNGPLPESNFWVFGILPIYPKQEYSNDGSRRRAILRGNLAKKAPLFADELYQREVQEREDYFTGSAWCDDLKAAAVEKYTGEYWQARILSDAGFLVCVL